MEKMNITMPEDLNHHNHYNLGHVISNIKQELGLIREILPMFKLKRKYKKMIKRVKK